MNSARPGTLEIAEASDFVKAHDSYRRPQVGIVLGTGMGSLVDDLHDGAFIDYVSIPHFPVSTVESHKGALHFGTLSGVAVAMMQGRFHYYEGYSLQQIALPVRTMKQLGISTLIVMNACGSLNPAITPGALVIATDHINFLGSNPLIGSNIDSLGPRFPDMSAAYDPDLVALAQSVAAAAAVPDVFTGVMISVTGPSFSTPAEYRLLRRMGADTVTMSTVPEVITAVHSGLRVAAISVATDYCMPDNLTPLTLAEVIEVASAAQPRMAQLIKGICSGLSC